MVLLIEHAVNQALGYRPKPSDIPVIENAGIHALVTRFDFLVEAEVIVHCEMEIKHIAANVFRYPLFIKPVPGTLGVTVKPELTTGNRATSHCLLYKRAGHKRDLIKENSRQCNALNQRIAGFVAATKEVVGISPIADSNNHLVFTAALDYRKQALEPSRNMDDNVTAQSLDSAPANGEALIIESGHTPKDKADSH